MRYLAMFCLMLAGCEAMPENSADQTAPMFSGTRIVPGIYSGQVVCDVEVWSATTGTFPGEHLEFNESFAFIDGGIPAVGVSVNPQNDVIDLGNIVFDVTNRTFHTTDITYLEEASLSSVLMQDRLVGGITWRFTYIDDNAIEYVLDFFYRGTLGGVAGSHNETCSGVLSRS